MKLELIGKDRNVIAVVEAHKFLVHVDGSSFWLAYHESHAMPGMYVVSSADGDSKGMRVMDVPHNVLRACGGDAGQAAKIAVNQLIGRVGEARFADVIRSVKVKG